ncbi:E3 ubiquitin-protein ligase RNF4 [Poecilia reticulata]|uniref:E3 ubiquitin-protein ligase RNF4 n=1 Tax=Poecilia reticulata TaxID=8081 RepID=UPI0004A3F630|nr:PREDICTED: E3 ubiquitin-protein ligase RNF4 [Poecilia reticulata]
MSSSAQRKRRPAGSSLVSRTRTKTSRAASSRTRRAAGAGDPAPPTEPIDVMDGAEDGVEEVVDLTCEGSESAVVDLTTTNESVLLVDEGPPGESYVLSSDEDEDAPTVVQAAITSTAHTSRLTPGLISCPVCLDLYSEIVESGRLVVSTKCGHVFCSQCLRDALTSSHTCPTCRKRLTSRQYHPLYI